MKRIKKIFSRIRFELAYWLILKRIIAMPGAEKQN